MSALKPQTPVPADITVHSTSKMLQIDYEDGSSFKISFELMRVYSQSAEVQGHGPGQETLQTGKRNVQIVRLDPVGNYAVQPTFSDGHSTGIFSWEYLHFLCTQQDALWAQYEEKLAKANLTRDTEMKPTTTSACASH